MKRTRQATPDELPLTKVDADIVSELPQTIETATASMTDTSLVNEYLTRSQTAKLLKVSIQTVINYTKRGLLTSYKIGRRVLYNAQAVRDAVNKESIVFYQHESTRTYLLNK
jgi:excisionase family DNA binding protein